MKLIQFNSKLLEHRNTMKACLAFLVASYLVVTASSLDELAKPSYNFVASLRTTSGNQTKYCTAVMMTPKNIVTAAHCVYFDKNKEHNVTFDLCYNSERCVTEVNNDDCRSVTYLYKPKKNFVRSSEGNKTDLQVVAVEDIAFLELSDEKQFKVGNETKLMIDLYAKVLDLQNMQGFVVTCNGNIWKSLHISNNFDWNNFFMERF